MPKRLALLLTILLGTVAAAAQPLSFSRKADTPSVTAKSVGLSAALTDKRIARVTDDGRVAALRNLLAAQSVERRGIEPQAGTCSFTETACNRNETGSLSPSDCTLDADNTSVDFWRFQGTAGQQVTITLRSTSFDAYLVLLSPEPDVVAEDDDSGGGSDARIIHTLTQTGVWTIAVNSLQPGYGSYTLSVSCSTGGPSCSMGSIDCGRTISGSLNSADCGLDDGTYAEFWAFSGTAGQRIVATMRSTAVNSHLFLLDPDAEVVAENDNGAGGSDARIDFTLPRSGMWVLAVNSLTPATGSFSLELSCPTTQPPPPTCSPCVASANTTCLLGNRFKVTLPSWYDPFAKISGQGTVLRYTENREEVHPQYGPLGATSFFSFYAHAPNSIEVTLRMFKGAAINDHYWVFMSGFTGAEYTIRVEDTQTCKVWQRGVPSSATNVVKDHEAFPFP